MLVGISGSLCSGKTEVVSFLIKKHGFKVIGVKEGNIIDENVILDHEFDNNADLIDFVTKNWLNNYVIRDISTLNILDSVSKRPFFLHIVIDSPALVRYQRYLSKHNEGTILEKFIEMSDLKKYSTEFQIQNNISQNEIKIINNEKTIDGFYKLLESINITDETRLRPTWDSYFMRLADLAALRSNCMKRRVGCVIVRSNRVIATGYNGTPRNFKNCNQGGCSRCNSGVSSSLHTCLCLHAEENALLESGRDRIGSGSILYCNTCPCLTCSIKIIQCGIEEVVYSQSYNMDELSSQVFKQAGVKLRQFTP
ncbi:hypothetical protein B5S31_g2431 [[Candida] boidinii]|nr:hypothetical protein B5S31_g2431 [[Candida] boidinii]OWB80448.1 hypothetical protein B5S32_g4726 [[Candida] boidinii]